jgi:hypothetical protein
VIVKVQVAQVGSMAMCLVYDKHRKFEYHGEMPEDVKLLMGSRVKAFFLAELDEQRRFSIGQEAPWQTW